HERQEGSEAAACILQFWPAGSLLFSGKTQPFSLPNHSGRRTFLWVLRDVIGRLADGTIDSKQCEYEVQFAEADRSRRIGGRRILFATAMALDSIYC
ncbi:MAG: hypothetical protein VX111_13095, partial [Planctomycetota bacterium]|nr:hypothetical protein [Planctomycetota bacterium]